MFSLENQIKSETLFFRDFEFLEKKNFSTTFLLYYILCPNIQKKMFEMNKQAGKKLTKQRRKMIIYVK